MAGSGRTDILRSLSLLVLAFVFSWGFALQFRHNVGKLCKNVLTSYFTASVVCSHLAGGWRVPSCDVWTCGTYHMLSCLGSVSRK